MQVHLYDFRWNNESEFEFQAALANKFAKKPLKIGDDLSMKLNSDISCAGSVRDGVFQPCPNKTPGKKKCEICRGREGGFIFTSFDGFDASNYTSADLAQIQGPHVVYLALFDRNIIKVGVSKLERKTLRQIEQGSGATLFIAETSDGISARQIETLFRKSGLIDKVKASTKKDFICPEITIAESEEVLREIFDKHKNCLKDYENLNSFLHKNPEFKDWGNVYHLQKIKENSKPFHSIKLQNQESVSGKIISARGAFLILELPDEIVSVCAKDLNGYEIEFEPIAHGLSLNKAFQSALF